MKFALNRRIAGIAVVSALAVTLSACGQDAVQTNETSGGSTDAATSALSGSIAGSGSSAQEKAQNAWLAEFMGKNSGVTISYDPTGSGAGREQFINGTVVFAGSDAAFKPAEVTAATERCFGSEPLELPLYTSPIAVVYNLPKVGVEHLNMTADTIARIFDGKITTWNDPVIAAANPDATLPDSPIVPVNRSDDSGTTDNFTKYLAAAAPGSWTYEPDGVWPITGTQSGAQTSGVLEVVNGAEGTIAYVDASRAGTLGTVAVGVGNEFVPFSPEAAAKVFEVSSPTADATDLRLTYDLARDTTESGTYPIVLVSYMLACSQYDNEADAANVAAYLTYIASPAGQELAASPEVAGIAPISDALRTKVDAAIAQITAG